MSGVALISDCRMFRRAGIVVFGIPNECHIIRPDAFLAVESLGLICQRRATTANAQSRVPV